MASHPGCCAWSARLPSQHHQPRQRISPFYVPDIIARALPSTFLNPTYYIYFYFIYPTLEDALSACQHMRGMRVRDAKKKSKHGEYENALRAGTRRHHSACPRHIIAHRSNSHKRNAV